MSDNAHGFSFFMTLKEDSKMPDVQALLEKSTAELRAGLAAIQTVHFARFLPLVDFKRLLFVAEIDGDPGAFIDALASNLHGVLTPLLKEMKDAPQEPVDENAAAFRKYVEDCVGGDMSVFCGYGDKTAQEIRDEHGTQPAILISPEVPEAFTTKRVAGAFALLMKLREPQKLRELGGRLLDPRIKSRIDAALASLDYVHYARFLPVAVDMQKPEAAAAMMIITEFDGVMQDYVMDFAAALDREFSMILSYMEGGPTLPVSQYPDEFWDYVQKNQVADTGLYCAYPDKTVLQIVGPDKPKRLPEQPKAPPVQVDLADVQANVLRGFRPSRAYHYFLRFPDEKIPVRGRDFVRNFPASSGIDRPQADSVCFNIGFTVDGLRKLGVPESMLGSFPQAFREGAAKRAKRIGDEGTHDTSNWKVGTDQTEEVHAVVSVLCRAQANDALALDTVEGLLDRLGILPILPLESPEPGRHYAQKAEILSKDDPNKIHFGYRDGISQPLIAGIHDIPADREPDAVPGDFLLGHEYVNSRGGRYIGRLFEPLVHNGTYACMRVIEQKVALFDQWLADSAKEAGVTQELLAAKVMGRWQEGTPITQYTKPLGAKLEPETPLDDFNYVAQKLTGSDAQGLRCPIGAHIRRFNPRGGMVLGLPWGRHVMRRGLPYGPPQGDTYEKNFSRGLVGMFMCGDLEEQFEFLLKVWGRGDLSAYGLRGTHDAFSSGVGTTFRFTNDKGEAKKVEVPPLASTLGSLYLFMPGLAALSFIGHGAWAPAQPQNRAMGQPPAPDPFDPTAPAFRNDPYSAYAEFRKSSPVKWIGHGYDAYWVFSHKLITEVCRPENKNLYLKPGHNRMHELRPFGIAANTDDGLFFMDPPRHTEVRPQLDEVFATAIQPLLATQNLPAPAGTPPADGEKQATQVLSTRLDEQVRACIAAIGGIEPFDVVAQVAQKIAPWVFAQTFGVPPGPMVPGIPPDLERAAVVGWTRAMLGGRDPHADPALRAAGGTSSMALRAYLTGLAREQAQPCSAGTTHIMSGLHKLSGCPVMHQPLSEDEVVNTSSHFALGGYLSTEFLIITGAYNLLASGQWKLLADEPGLIKHAVWEMLRYDAPFQMADRWVARDCYLGDVPLPAGSKLVVVYGSANRDEKEFPDRPGEFDIRREYDPQKIYGFGHGIHRCIGEQLALATTEAVIGALVKAFPDAKFSGKGQWLADPYFRSLDALAVLPR